MRLAILTLTTLTLTACLTPYSIKVKNGNEQNLSCQELAMEIQKTEQTRQAAHEDDKFTAKKIIPTNGVSTVYNLWVVDARAKERTELLQGIARQKGC